MSNQVAEIVTARIIEELEKGTIPWRKPWDVAGLMPTSLSTGKAYRGINSLLLGCVAQSEGYSKNLWVTFNQAKELGGSVRKGSKSVPVVLWKPFDVVNEESGESESRFIMRYFNVFNVDQVDELTIPERFLVEREPVTVAEGVQKLWEGYRNRPELEYVAQGRAYYSPLMDKITLPPLHAFTSESAHAETLLHEMIHSTGHASRLDRLESGAFGCEPYAKEELVAELGAAMLASVAGITIEWENHAAYVKSWLDVLKEDSKLLIYSAQRASKAVAWVTGESVAESMPEAA